MQSSKSTKKQTETKRKLYFSSCALMTVLGITLLPVIAQSAEYNETYQKTLRDAGETDMIHGIRAGGFLFLPAMGLNTEYDDNIDNDKNDHTSDIITTATGSVSVKSNWNRHMIMAGTTQKKVKYKERKSRDFVSNSYFAQARYDVAKETEMNTSVSHSKSHLSRGTGADIDVTNPLDYWVDTATIGFSRTLGYIQFAVDGKQIISTILDKARALTSDYEKKKTKSTGGVISYVRSPGNALYLRTNFSDNEYNLVNGTTRETDLWNIRSGMEFSTGGLYSGGLFGRWQRRTDSSLDSADQFFSLGGNLQWNITRLTSLRYSFDKNFSEGESSVSDTALLTSQQLVLSNSFTRLWDGSISLQKDDYDYSVSGTPLEATLYIGKVESSYALTDSLDFNIGVSHQRKESDNKDSEYNSNSVYVSFTYVH